jgi:hypothetical protein
MPTNCEAVRDMNKAVLEGRGLYPKILVKRQATIDIINETVDYSGIAMTQSIRAITNLRNSLLSFFTGRTSSSLRSITNLRNSLLERTLRFVKPQIMTLDDIDDSGDAIAIVPPPGSIVVYYAARGEEIIDRLSVALSTRDNSQLSVLGNKARKQFNDQPRLSETQILEEISSVPCLFDVRYGRKTVAENVGLFGSNSFGTVTLTYIGGPIADEDFQLVEYCISNDTPGYLKEFGKPKTAYF